MQQWGPGYTSWVALEQELGVPSAAPHKPPYHANPRLFEAYTYDAWRLRGRPYVLVGFFSLFPYSIAAHDRSSFGWHNPSFREGKRPVPTANLPQTKAIKYIFAGTNINAYKYAQAD